MTDPTPTRPQRLHDSDEPHNDLMDPADPIEEEEAHGRIGYGRFGERTPYILAVGIVLVVLVIAGVDWWRNRDDTADRARLNQPAPAIALTTLDGTSFDLAAQRGKVVVVNFWGTWCEPCKDEMPALVDLATSNPDIVVIGIAGATDQADKVRQFEAQYGITYPLAIDTGASGPIGDTASAYGIIGYPSTFVIDPDGNVTYLMLGPIELDSFQQVIDDARSS